MKEEETQGFKNNFRTQVYVSPLCDEADIILTAIIKEKKLKMGINFWNTKKEIYIKNEEN